jgi:hypothetical protein
MEGFDPNPRGSQMSVSDSGSGILVFSLEKVRGARDQGAESIHYQRTTANSSDPYMFALW